MKWHVPCAPAPPKRQDDCVVCNEEQGAYLATRHMLEAGRKPAFLSPFNVLYSSEQRLTGYLRACEEAGLPEAERRSAICESNEEILTQLLQWKSEGVNGLFMFCDLEARNANLVMHQHSLRSPDDFVLVGFDNIQDAWNLLAPLCTVGWDIIGMVDSVISLLRRRIHHEDFEPQTVIFEPHLICRSSCGR